MTVTYNLDKPQQGQQSAQPLTGMKRADNVVRAWTRGNVLFLEGPLKEKFEVPNTRDIECAHLDEIPTKPMVLSDLFNQPEQQTQIQTGQAAGQQRQVAGAQQ